MNDKNIEGLMERVNELMDKQYLKKKDVAEKLGMEYLAFWRRLKGKRGVDVNFLSKLAFILGTSVSYLMGETDNPDIQNTQIGMQIISEKTPERTRENFAYWGGVLDEAKKVAQSSDEQEKKLIASLLKRAYEMLISTVNNSGQEIYIR